MPKKLKLNIGYLPIIDHLILGLSLKQDSKRFKHIDVKAVRFESWTALVEAIKREEVDGAFIMAPFAIVLKSQGIPIKTVLLGHREGLGLVVNNNIHKVRDLEHQTIGIPHRYSMHNILLYKYLTQKGLDYFHDIKTMEIPSLKFIDNMITGKIAGYMGSEPFGVQAENQAIGKIQVMSKDIQKHHIDCVLVLKEKLLEQKEAIQELIDSLISAGNLMYQNPQKVSRLGASFLEQPESVLYEIIRENRRRVTSWDLLPLAKEFEDVQDDMVDKLKILNKKIDTKNLVDSAFATKSYERISLINSNKERRKELIEKFVLPAIVLLALLLIWQLATGGNPSESVSFPSPISVIKGTMELIPNGVLANNIFTSLYRVFAGFFLATVLAIPIGLMLGFFKKLKYSLDPLIQIIKPISPIAWIPLAIMWFGIGDKPAIFIIFITAFFPILLAAIDAVNNIDPVLIKTAQNFGASRIKMLTSVILPASFPYLMVGIRISLGISWVIVVAAEMVGMRSGLGYMILDARNFLRTDLIIAGMLIIGLIGLLLDRILSFAENKVRKKWGYKEIS